MEMGEGIRFLLEEKYQNVFSFHNNVFLSIIMLYKYYFMLLPKRNFYLKNS